MGFKLPFFFFPSLSQIPHQCDEAVVNQSVLKIGLTSPKNVECWSE